MHSGLGIMVCGFGGWGIEIIHYSNYGELDGMEDAHESESVIV